MFSFRRREYSQNEVTALSWVPVIVLVLIALGFMLRLLTGI